MGFFVYRRKQISKKITGGMRKDHDATIRPRNLTSSLLPFRYPEDAVCGQRANSFGYNDTHLDALRRDPAILASAMAGSERRGPMRVYGNEQRC